MVALRFNSLASSADDQPVIAQSLQAIVLGSFMAVARRSYDRSVWIQPFRLDAIHWSRNGIERTE